MNDSHSNSDPDPDFDVSAQRMIAEQRWFDDFELGERYVLPSRTMTEAIFLAFQAASGDNHPIHYNAQYCKARGLQNMLAHGYQVAIQSVAGAGMFPHQVEESLVAFLEQSSRFLHAVVVGDTLYPTLEVDELAPNRSTGVVGFRSTIHNQDSVLVLDGRHRYLLRRAADRVVNRGTK